ncbi:MAG: hypothetical protein U0R72_18505 [Nakamurella multipartita]
MADTIAEFLGRFGAAGTKRRLGIVIAGDTAPTHDELSAAARSFDLGIITLTAR